jgi:hypothetical protein
LIVAPVGGLYNLLTPLPDGTYESWVNFVDNGGGYWLTTDKQVAMKRFVKTKRSNPVAVAKDRR